MRQVKRTGAISALVVVPAMATAGLAGTATAAPAGARPPTPDPAARIAALRAAPWGRWANGSRGATAATSVRPALRAAGATSGITDARGDVTDENGDPVTQPKADLIAAAARDTGTTITLSATTATLANPATDPGWQNYSSGLNWTLMSTPAADAASEPIAFVSLDAAGGALDPEVYDIQGPTGPGDGASYAPPACDAHAAFTPRGPHAGYSVSFPASCLGQIGRFWWSVSMTYDPPSDTDGSLAVGDDAPDGLTLPEVDTFPPAQGYWLAAADGGVFTHGSAVFHGSAGGRRLNAPIVAATATPDGRGYFLVARDGGVFTYGDAAFKGSTAARRLRAPITTVALTPDGEGYLLVSTAGDVFSFGDAPVLGSIGYQLGAPVVAAAVTPDDGGYWLFTAAGDVFSFGDAPFEGSLAGTRLNAPIVGAAVDPGTGGYWLVGRDGGVFAFDAPFYGSEGGHRLNQRIVGITSAQDGTGYRLVAADGGLFDFGTARFAGSQAAHRLNAPILAGMSVEP